MKSGLMPGAEVEFTFEVTADMRPSFDGAVVHDVLSTVAMIYQMERAGRYLIVPYLEPHEEGAGYELQVKHVGPAVAGQLVHVRAICTLVSQNRVVCDVTARTDVNVVGSGTFTQALFPKEDMLAKLERIRTALADEAKGESPQ